MDETQQLKELGLKITAPRLKILQILMQSNKPHLSADALFKQLGEQGEEIGLATVYRVLAQFELAGLIKRHNFEGGYSVYELDQGSHHDHLVCLDCGYIEEFFDAEIEARQSEIATQAGFKMSGHVLNIYGNCGRCI